MWITRPRTEQGESMGDRAPYTTPEMLHLYGEALQADKTYDEFLEMVATAAGYDKEDTAKKKVSPKLAKERYHRFRHELRKKKIKLPILKGAPVHRLSKDDLMREFPFLISAEE